MQSCYSGASALVLLSDRVPCLPYRPADIAGSVALRSEEDGFSGRPAASMLEAVFAAAGFPDSVLADEYFFQVHCCVWDSSALMCVASPRNSMAP